MTAMTAMLSARSRRPLTTVERIRAEALRERTDPIGHPLPLTGIFSAEAFGAGTYTTPAYQVSLIEDGHYLLPIFHWSHTDIGHSEDMPSDEGAALNQVKAWGLPLCYVSSQWERLFYDQARYSERPFATNPLAFNLSEQAGSTIDPLGPVEAWVDLGADWFDRSNIIAWDHQTIYPNPPMLLFLSNNEAHKHLWQDGNSSKRLIDEHGTTSNSVRARIYGDGWVERYSTLFHAFRDAMASEDWANNSKFIGYNVSHVPFMGRWWGWWWEGDTLATINPLRLDPMHAAWDGTFGEYYLHNWMPITDFNVWSVQVEQMNTIPFLEEAYAVDPEYWHEVIIWDGHWESEDPAVNKRLWYESIGQTFTPARYEGMVQFAMWLTRPRVVREFRFLSSRETIGFGYLDAIMASVDRVHENAVLRRFWRNGTLVQNTAEDHPYQEALLEGTDELPRWFMLTADVNPARPWTVSTELLVFGLARVLGEEPHREWLVYAHSPRQERMDVKVTLPGYGIITIDVQVAGSFHVVNETSGTVSPLK